MTDLYCLFVCFSVTVGFETDGVDSPVVSSLSLETGVHRLHRTGADGQTLRASGDSCRFRLDRRTAKRDAPPAKTGDYFYFPFYSSLFKYSHTVLSFADVSWKRTSATPLTI